MAMRWLWWGSLVIISAVAIIVQTDRYSLERPQYASYIPDNLKSFSLIREASVQAEAGPKGLNKAQRVVFLHPIPAKSLTILAIALNNANQESLSAKAILMSAERGWREPIAQRAIALAAAGSGDADVAGERLVALWKTFSNTPDAEIVSRRLLAKPTIAKSFARHLDRNSSWSKNFIQWSGDNLGPSIVGEIVKEANDRGVEFSCIRLGKIAKKFLTQGVVITKNGIWPAYCASSNKHLNEPYIYNFELPDQIESQDPFSWRYMNSADLSIEVSSIDALGAISYKNTSQIQKLVAQRYLLLPPGEYTLSYRASAVVSYGLNSDVVQLRLSCRSGGRSQVLPKTKAISKREVKVIVPEKDCLVQSVSIWAGRGRVESLQFMLR